MTILGGIIYSIWHYQSFAILWSSEAKLRVYKGELPLVIITQSFALLLLFQYWSSEAKLRVYKGELPLRYS